MSVYDVGKHKEIRIYLFYCNLILSFYLFTLRHILTFFIVFHIHNSKTTFYVKKKIIV